MKIPKKIIHGSYENFHTYIMREKESTKPFFSYDPLDQTPSPASRFFMEDKDHYVLGKRASHPNISPDSLSSNLSNTIQHGEQQEKNKIINEKHHPIESFFSSLPSQPSKSKKNMVDEQDHILRSPHHHLSNHILIENGVEIIK